MATVELPGIRLPLKMDLSDLQSAVERVNTLLSQVNAAMAGVTTETKRNREENESNANAVARLGREYKAGVVSVEQYKAKLQEAASTAKAGSDQQLAALTRLRAMEQAEAAEIKRTGDEAARIAAQRKKADESAAKAARDSADEAARAAVQRKKAEEDAAKGVKDSADAVNRLFREYQAGLVSLDGYKAKLREIAASSVTGSEQQIAALTRLKKAEEGAANEATTLGSHMKTALTGVSEKLQAVAGVISGLVGGAITAGLGKAVDAASNLNESIGKSGVVFGASAKSIEAWAQNAADKMGYSRQAALETAATFGNLFEGNGASRASAAEMSRTIVQLGSDLASFNNIDTEQVMKDLQSGLVGQVEPLRKYGVNLSETALKQKALDMGLVATTKGTLPDSIKMQAAYALILEKTKNAQGDYSRTSAGLANSQRTLDAKLADLAVTVGKVLLPAKLQLVNIVGKVAAAFEKLAPQVQQFLVFGTAIVGALAIAIPAVSAIVVAFETFAAVAGAVALPITAVIVGVTALGAAFATNAGGIRDAAQTVLAPVAGFVRESWEKLVSWWQDTLPILMETVRIVTSAIRQFWETHGERIMAIVSHAWNYVKDIVSGTLDLILGIVKTVMQLINGDWSGAWDTFLDTAAHAAERTVDAIKEGLMGLGNVIALIAELMFKADLGILKAAARALGVDTGARIADGILAGLQKSFPAIAGWIQGLRDKLGGVISGLKPEPSAPPVRAVGKGGTDYSKYSETGGGFGYGDFDPSFGATAPKTKTGTGGKPTLPPDPDAAKKEAARQERIAESLADARKMDANTAVDVIKRAYDALKKSLSALERINDPKAFDTQIAELRRLSDLVKTRQMNAAAGEVTEAKAKLKRAPDADKQAAAQADLNRVEAEVRGRIPGITGDATDRRADITALNRDKYKADRDARAKDAAAAERFANDSLRDTLADLSERRKAHQIGSREYLKQLAFIHASQKAGSDAELSVRRLIDAENQRRLTEAERDAKLYEQSDAAVASASRGTAEKQKAQALADVGKNGSNTEDGVIDPVAKIVQDQTNVEKQSEKRRMDAATEGAEHEIRVNAAKAADYKKRVGEMADSLKGTLGTAMGDLFQGKWKSALQVFVEEFRNSLIKMAAAWAASGIAKLLTRKEVAVPDGGTGGLGIVAGDNKTASGGAGDLIGSLLGNIPGLGAIGGIGKTISGAFKGLKKVFGFSAGGMLPDVAMVHRGEMLVQPRPGSMALPAALTRALMDGGRGGHHVSVSIQTGDVRGQSDINALAEEVAWHTRKALPTARAERF